MATSNNCECEDCTDCTECSDCTDWHALGSAPSTDYIDCGGKAFGRALGSAPTLGLAHRNARYLALACIVDTSGRKVSSMMLGLMMTSINFLTDCWFSEFCTADKDLLAANVAWA